MRNLISALRVHHWAKNLLVYVPVLLAHQANPRTLWHGAVAFVSLCLVSSAAYVLNDLVDIEADRTHTTKRFRPFASGALSVFTGWTLVPCLLAAGLIVASTVSRGLFWSVVGYSAGTLAYSIALKKLLGADVIVIAGLFCTRLIAGGEATGIEISPWTFAFALFLFLSVALVKRYAELYNRRAAGGGVLGRRAYQTEDMPIVASLGCAAAMTSVLIIALYVNGEEVRNLYSRPKLLWLICTVVLVWISRLWLLANRGEVHEDPVLFALHDPGSLVLGLSAAVLFAFAI